MAGAQDFGDAQASDAAAVPIIIQHHTAEKVLIHAYFRLFLPPSKDDMNSQTYVSLTRSLTTCLTRKASSFKST